MAGTFFTSWKPWEQLSFILVCLIIVVIIFGFAKRAHAAWKARKYQAIAGGDEQEDLELQQQHQQIEQDAPDAQEDTPFGIRALELELGLHGVWIPPNHTPEPARRPEPTVCGGASFQTLTCNDDDSQLLTSIPDRCGSATTASIPVPSETPFYHAVTTDHISSGQLSHDPSPAVSSDAQSRGSCPPVSIAKYSNAPFKLRHFPAVGGPSTGLGLPSFGNDSGEFESGAGDAMKAGEQHQSASKKPDDPKHEGYQLMVSAFSSDSDIDSNSCSTSAANNNDDNLRSANAASNVDVFKNLRMSQAAEIGQFTPRERLPSLQSEPGAIASHLRHARSSDDDEHLSAHPRHQYSFRHTSLNAQPWLGGSSSSSGASAVPRNPSPLSASAAVFPHVRHETLSPPVAPHARLSRTYSRSASALRSGALNASERVVVPSPSAWSDQETTGLRALAGTPSSLGNYVGDRRTVRSRGTEFEIMPTSVSESPEAVQRTKQVKHSASLSRLSAMFSGGKSRIADQKRKLQKKRPEEQS